MSDIVKQNCKKGATHSLILYVWRMAYEKECDLILRHLDNHIINGCQISELWPTVLYKAQSMPDHQALSKMIAILISNGFVKAEKETNISFGVSGDIIADNYIYITLAGTNFINTDCFEERAKRLELDRKSKLLEYSLKKRTFAIALIALIVSLCSLLKDCIVKNTEEAIKKNTNNSRIVPDVPNGIRNS
jgi:hypothetical protein